jgi:hypothetical protein
MRLPSPLPSPSGRGEYLFEDVVSPEPNPHPQIK